MAHDRFPDDDMTTKTATIEIVPATKAHDHAA
jgi:hypothetical protein